MDTFTELEDKLQNDYSGSELRQLLTQLNEAAREMEKQLRQPIDSEAYASIERRRHACLASTHIIETIWSHHHAKNN